jgi:hypothetical protein
MQDNYEAMLHYLQIDCELPSQISFAHFFLRHQHP